MKNKIKQGKLKKIKQRKKKVRTKNKDYETEKLRKKCKKYFKQENLLN